MVSTWARRVCVRTLTFLLKLVELLSEIITDVSRAMGRIAHLNDENFDDDDIEYTGEEWAGTVFFWMIFAGLWELVKIFGTLFLVAGFLVFCGFKPLLTLYSYMGTSFMASVPVLAELLAAFLLVFLLALGLWCLFERRLCL